MQSIFPGRLVELGAPADGVGTFAASCQAPTPELSETAGSASSVSSACDLALQFCVLDVGQRRALERSANATYPLQLDK